MVHDVPAVLGLFYLLNKEITVVTIAVGEAPGARKRLLLFRRDSRFHDQNRDLAHTGYICLIIGAS